MPFCTSTREFSDWVFMWAAPSQWVPDHIKRRKQASTSLHLCCCLKRLPPCQPDRDTLIRKCEPKQPFCAYMAFVKDFSTMNRGSDISEEAYRGQLFGMAKAQMSAAESNQGTVGDGAAEAFHGLHLFQAVCFVCPSLSPPVSSLCCLSPSCAFQVHGSALES